MTNGYSSTSYETNSLDKEEQRQQHTESHQPGNQQDIYVNRPEKTSPMSVSENTESPTLEIQQPTPRLKGLAWIRNASPIIEQLLSDSQTSSESSSQRDMAKHISGYLGEGVPKYAKKVTGLTHKSSGDEPRRSQEVSSSYKSNQFSNYTDFEEMNNVSSLEADKSYVHGHSDRDSRCIS